MGWVSGIRCSHGERLSVKRIAARLRGARYATKRAVVGNHVPHHGPAKLEILTGLTQTVTARARNSVVGFDVVTNCAFVVVMMNGGARQLRMER